MKTESVKKSLEKSKNVLEEKRKNGQAKILHKKTNVYINWYDLRSGAIKNIISLVNSGDKFMLPAKMRSCKLLKVYSSFSKLLLESR